MAYSWWWMAKLSENRKVGATTSQGLQIADGLIGGEDIIVNPPADLKDGQRVRPKRLKQHG